MKTLKQIRKSLKDANCSLRYAETLYRVFKNCKAEEYLVGDKNGNPVWISRY